MPEIVEKGKGALTHKVGPLPLWGWAIAGVAAVVVGKKLAGGRGGGAAPGSFGIPSSAGAGSFDSGPSFVNPAQNARGGTDTAIGASAPPWWSSPPAWWNATPSVPLTGQPSTNGSAGAGPATADTKGAAPSTSWWRKLINPMGNLPTGASVTTVGGTAYSLSSDALARAGITGAAAPVAPAAPAAPATSSSPSESTAPVDSGLDIARRAFANAGVAPGTSFFYKGGTYQT